MLFLILGTIIGIVLMFKSKEIWDKVECVFLGGLLGCFVGGVIWFVFGCILGSALPYNEIVTRQEICALNDSSKIEGQKYLFSGYIEETLVYRYVVNSEKGKHIEECEIDNSYIKDIESNEPYVERHEYELKHGWFWLFAVDLKSAENYSVFYVPNGTITTEYNIDLQ